MDIKEQKQIPFDLGHRPAYDREDFWVSECNIEAISWLDKYPDWPAHVSIIIGPPASGKTHLLQVWKKETSAKEVDAGSLAIDETLSEYKNFIIDDLNKIIGDIESEKKLFHLYNITKEQNGFLLLTSEKPIKEYNFTLPDLKSRLMSVPIISLGTPDDELIAVVLTKLFSDRQIFVSQDVVQFIITRSERSFSAIRDLVEKIDQKALSNKRSITIPLIREFL